MNEEDAEQYRVEKDLYCIPNVGGDSADSAVLFVHGFTGDSIGTWGEFPQRLRADPDLAGFDCFYWGYPSALHPFEVATRGFWSADPGISTVGKSLRSMLGTSLRDYQRLMFVGHSMGGLVVQTFVLEEIERGASEHLSRLAEIVLYASPSGGLESARRLRWFKRQIADMSKVGPFIKELRRAWRSQIDARRADDDRPGKFLLTLVAGQRDKFVPEESSLEPFPLDEHEVVPGNHVQLVKPEVSGERTVAVLKKRLLRDTPTPEELRVVHGESEEAVAAVARIQAAAELGDVEGLGKIADELMTGAVPLPTAEKAVALALSGQREHQRAVSLFDRYVSFELDNGTRPFEHDAYAVQQMAVSLSALGRNQEAIERLELLPEDIRSDGETMGIRAGRLKREWLETRSNATAGRKAFQTYRAAYENAQAAQDYEQTIYNGINTAFMGLMLGVDYEELAEELFALADGRADPDYWTLATKAEALLLLERFDEARDVYAATFVEAGTPRNLATTAAQALNIIAEHGNPPEADGIKALLDANYESLPNAVEEQEALAEAEELAS